jgi:hypothetical protein
MGPNQRVGLTGPIFGDMESAVAWLLDPCTSNTFLSFTIFKTTLVICKGGVGYTSVVF